jgi:hypothetical protein
MATAVNTTQVIDLATAREERVLNRMTRTPELLILMAVLKALPEDARSKVATMVRATHEACPACEASEEAAVIVAQLAHC